VDKLMTLASLPPLTLALVLGILLSWGAIQLLKAKVPMLRDVGTKESSTERTERLASIAALSEAARSLTLAVDALLEKIQQIHEVTVAYDRRGSVIPQGCTMAECQAVQGLADRLDCVLAKEGNG